MKALALMQAAWLALLLPATLLVPNSALGYRLAEPSP